MTPRILGGMAPTTLGRRRLLQGADESFSNCARPCSLNSFFFPAIALVHRGRLQLIHDSCAHLHQAMPLPEPLTQIATMWIPGNKTVSLSHTPSPATRPLLADKRASIGRPARPWSANRASKRVEAGFTFRGQAKQGYKGRNHSIAQHNPR